MGTAHDTATEPDPLVTELYREHFTRLVRLAALLGADDPEDVAQEAFERLHRRQRKLRDPQAALSYLRATVCNLVRNRHRHLRVARLRAPAVRHEASSEQTALIHEDHREVLAALAHLPARQREALALRYWHDLSEQEIAEAMGVSTGTVKTHTSRGHRRADPDAGGEAMTDVEERLRAALRAKADTIEPSREAWERPSRGAAGRVACHSSPFPSSPP